MNCSGFHELHDTVDEDESPVTKAKVEAPPAPDQDSWFCPEELNQRKQELLAELLAAIITTSAVVTCSGNNENPRIDRLTGG